MRKILQLWLVVLMSFAPGAWAGSHEQATAAAEATAGDRVARVAGGQSVTLAESKNSASQWAERRPDYRALRPK